MPELPKLTNKESVELIVYQLGELKNMVGNLTVKFEGMDKRVADVEKKQAVADEVLRNQPKLNPQEIILRLIAAFGSMGTVAYIIDKTGALK